VHYDHRVAYVQRDLILRMIEQLARAFGRIVGLKRDGRLEEALQEVGRAADEFLGPSRHTLEMVDPRSAVKLLSDRDRIEGYARLTAEEASIRALLGDEAGARARASRARELLIEARDQGHQLGDDAVGLLADLQGAVRVNEP
jgi:hypothetical protein